MSYTRIPDSIIDEARLNPYQYQLFTIIVRKTDGWCKASDGISLSQFEKLVTFKRNKIISTLKELEEMNVIKIINTKRKDGGDSFNMYSISDTLVSEINGGSASHKQGGVREENTQKKANAKETNTDKKIYKKSLEWESLSKETKLLHTESFRVHCTENQVDHEEIEKFIDYCKSKGNKYKDFSAAFRNWCKNAKKWNAPKTQYKSRQQRTNDFIDNALGGLGDDSFIDVGVVE